MEPIVHLSLPPQCRIIAVSDIHTYHELLLDMLERNKYDPDRDYLIIIGDILEHGRNNIDTLRSIMKLCLSERAVAVMGNNDTMTVRMAFTYDYSRFSECTARFPNCTYLEMAAALGISAADFTEESLDILREKINSAFADELAFINALPTAVVTDDHIFVHAGIENRPDWENTENRYTMCTKYWMREGHCADKTVVVGHIPTNNYKSSNNTSLPIIDLERRMIAIDGGMGIRWASQINLLNIMKDGSCYSYDTFWDTPYEKRTVLSDYSSGEKHVYIDVEKTDLTLISEENGISVLRNNLTGETGWTLSEQVFGDKEHPKVWQCLSASPDLKKGEIISLVGTIRDYSFIVNSSGSIGWVKSALISDEKVSY